MYMLKSGLRLQIILQDESTLCGNKCIHYRYTEDWFPLCNTKVPTLWLYGLVQVPPLR